MFSRTSYLVFGVAIALLFGGLSLYLFRQNKQLQEEGRRLERSLSVALSDCQTWKDKDSISRGRADALELSLNEYKRLLSASEKEAARLIQRNRDLTRVTETQSATIIALRAVPRDTVIIRETMPIPARSVSCGDAWYTFEGTITDDDFMGVLHNRDSVLIVESVRYSRFLFWKTKRIKNIRVDVEMKNPHTDIVDLRHVVISEK